MLVPAKRLGAAKSRLTGLPDQTRQELATAFLADVVTAALAADVGTVTVVTDDPKVLDLAQGWGAAARVVSGGLNQAVRDVAPPGAPTAVLVGDLPAVKPDQLRSELRRPGEFFVPDLHGTGTTTLAGRNLHPRFGPESAAAHAADGLLRVELGVSGMTVDVDTWADLDVASRLGLGPYTAALIERVDAIRSALR